MYHPSSLPPAVNMMGFPVKAPNAQHNAGTGRLHCDLCLVFCRNDCVTMLGLSSSVGWRSGRPFSLCSRLRTTASEKLPDASEKQRANQLLGPPELFRRKIVHWSHLTADHLFHFWHLKKSLPFVRCKLIESTRDIVPQNNSHDEANDRLKMASDSHGTPFDSQQWTVMGTARKGGDEQGPEGRLWRCAKGGTAVSATMLARFDY